MKNMTDTKIMIFGIIGAALCYAGYGAVISLVFGILATQGAKNYLAENGELTKKAKIGKILGLIAMIVSIVALAVTVIVTIATGGLACAAALSNN